VPEWITVNQAAVILVVKPDRVRKLCRAGKLKTERFGRAWMVDKESVIDYKKTYRKPGPKPDVAVKVDPATATALAQPRQPAGEEEDGVELGY
jgi:excisionase family DNA binding protein